MGNYINCLDIFAVKTDPSPIIGYPCHSLTYQLTNTCLVDLIDVTLACKDDNAKLVEAVTVADVDDEDRISNSLLQIWKLRLGHKARPAQLAELPRSEFNPELFPHSAYVKFFVTFATKVPYLTFCDKMRHFLI